MNYSETCLSGHLYRKATLKRVNQKWEVYTLIHLSKKFYPEATSLDRFHCIRICSRQLKMVLLCPYILEV